ncbi:MAG: glycosyltransferase family 4 protein [Bryobacteraceae bacterium]|nr:glycosyltransferase family 4 protein [Bryobacteraceae bacterium]
MKILSITAGAANMYCGSCLRDNALAAELNRQGHDVILTPLYTPTRTDEENVSHERVFFSGINLYLQQKSAFFQKSLGGMERLLDSPTLLRWVSSRSMSVNPAELGALTISMLEGVSGPHRKEVDKLLEWATREAPPDVIHLPYALVISLAGPLREGLRRPVCCSLQGEDLFLNGLPEKYRRRAIELIQRQSDNVDAFLPVSAFYASLMSKYLGISEEKMFVTPAGINMDGHRYSFRREGRRYKIGYFARIAPEKGLHVLAEAYRDLRWQRGLEGTTLEVAGYMAPEHARYLADIKNKLKSWGLAGRMRYRGELTREEKIDFLQSLDVLSVPCTFDEPKGMFALEAMANGVPVVLPRRGAFPEIIENTGGGVLVEPDNPASLAEGIWSVLRDRDFAEQLRSAGYENVRKHYSIEQTAQRAAQIFQWVVEMWNWARVYGAAGK